MPVAGPSAERFVADDTQAPAPIAPSKDSPDGPKLGSQAPGLHEAPSEGWRGPSASESQADLATIRSDSDEVSTARWSPTAKSSLSSPADSATCYRRNHRAHILVAQDNSANEGLNPSRSDDSNDPGQYDPPRA